MGNGTLRKFLFTHVILIVLFMIGAVAGRKAEAAPTSFSYQGRIVSADGTPLEFANVSFEFTVTSPDGACVLFKEQLTGIDMRNSGGLFDTPIGRGTQIYPTDPALNLLTAFDNSAPLTCLGGMTFTPASDDGRKLRVQFWDGAGWRLITPDAVIRSVPYAGHAMHAIRAESATKLGTYSASDFILKNTLPIAACASGDVLGWNGSLFSCVTPSSGGGGSGTSGLPTTANNRDLLRYSGSAWVAGTLNYRDLVNTTGLSPWPAACGAGEFVAWVSATDSFACSPVSATAVTTALGYTPANATINLTAGTGLVGGGTLAANRTLAVDVGTTAGKIPQLDASGKILASLIPTGAGSRWSANGSNIYFNSASVGIGTNAPQTPLEVAGAVTATQYCIGASCLSAWPTPVTSLAWTDITGKPSTFPSGLTGTSPITVSAGANPVVALATSGVAAGTYRSVTVDTYGRVTGATNPSTLAAYGVTLNNGQIFIGDGSNVATARTISGDIAMTNAGVVTVESLQSRAVATTAPANNQVLKWNGTAWSPSADLTSGGTVTSVSGTAPIVVATGTSTPAISLAAGGVTAAHLATAVQDGLWTVTGNNIYRPANTLVGIGISSPRATLDVDGAIVSNATSDNSTAMTINFATGNIQWTSSNCKAFALHNLKDGGAYTFVVKGDTSATCSFTAFSGAGTGTLTVHMPVDHAATFALKDTMYNLLVAGTDVYLAWTPGY